MLEKILLRLPDKLLTHLTNWAKKRAIRKLGGVPVAWVIYKPNQAPPNVYIHLHPECKHDEYISLRMGEIAQHIRANYFKGEEYES